MARWYLCAGDILHHLRGDSVPADVAAAGGLQVRHVPVVVSAHILRGAERGARRRRGHERPGELYNNIYTLIWLYGNLKFLYNNQGTYIHDSGYK